MVRLSILDLAPITQGSDAATAFRHSLDYARHAERLGIHRYWLAEHHNMPGIASAATADAARRERTIAHPPRLQIPGFSRRRRQNAGKKLPPRCVVVVGLRL